MKRDKMVKKLNNKGFSMVEIIIVIAIIAILATVLAPQYFKHLESARETTDLDSYRSIVSALQVELINDELESGTIAFNDGSVTTATEDAVKTLLSGVGINLDNVTMKSSKYKTCTITFQKDAGIISFSTANGDLAKALGINETTTPTE